MNTPEQTNSRRDFFLRPLRWTVAVVMGGVSVSLLCRGSSTTEDTCNDPRGRIGCGDCSALSGCRLPRGLSFKQFKRRENA